jgi:hypothetical protein
MSLKWSVMSKVFNNDNDIKLKDGFFSEIFYHINNFQILSRLILTTSSFSLVSNLKMLTKSTFFITFALLLHASAGSEDPPSPPDPFLTKTYTPPPQHHHASPPQPPATTSSHSSSHRNVGVIVGIVFGSVAGVAVVATGLSLLGRYIKERSRQGRPVQAAGVSLTPWPSFSF